MPLSLFQAAAIAKQWHANVQRDKARRTMRYTVRVVRTVVTETLVQVDAANDDEARDLAIQKAKGANDWKRPTGLEPSYRKLILRCEP